MSCVVWLLLASLTLGLNFGYALANEIWICAIYTTSEQKLLKGIARFHYFSCSSSKPWYWPCPTDGSSFSLCFRKRRHRRLSPRQAINNDQTEKELSRTAGATTDQHPPTLMKIKSYGFKSLRFFELFVL